MKDWFMAAHEQLIEEYLEEHPEATDDDAYKATEDKAHDRMVDNMSAAADDAHDRMSGDR